MITCISRSFLLVFTPWYRKRFLKHDIHRRKLQIKCNIDCTDIIVKSPSELQISFTMSKNIWLEMPLSFAAVLTECISFPKNFRSAKVGPSPSKKVCVIWLIESLLQMMKNAFYFILIALFALKIFKSLSQLLVM